MMKIVFHRPENCKISVQKSFHLFYEYEWMNDPEVQQMVQDIDNTKLLNPAAAFSPILGSISVEQLSGGVKGLIMIKHDMEHRAYSSCIFGDNCAEWLARLSFQVDFTFYSQHCFYFSDGLQPGESRPVNFCGENGEVLQNSREAFQYTIEHHRWYENEE